MTEKDFIPNSYTTLNDEGEVSYTSPSNIALVKYWGKKENQVPANPSISFTLTACATTTKVKYKKRENRNEEFSFDLLFEGESKEEFKPKINTFLKRVEVYLPFLKDYHFVINTTNSFPHSSGIASSASGMSALALCFMEMEKSFSGTMSPEHFNRKVSFLSRLGSGSACRSIEGTIVQWGETPSIEGSSNLYGIKYPYEVHGVFHNFHDTILLVDKGEKQVSSTVGHELMHGHPFAQQRFDQAHSNLSKLKTIIKEGNLVRFIEIVESEALTLHAMMMTSHPYFILMKPNTLSIINEIWKFRKESRTHVCFTLDAGANVHVLYPEGEKDIIFPFIIEKLVPYCQNGQYICDRIGLGAKKL
ncbi:diphosphomevalonate/mevalonate 3,5-bisphosphate decarboxylase family protein [Maribacter hydrothermalis]|uniref:Diphosphomevalonate decarboxylase n=1 Tax=Maribacter hydrothermalis TaxID=1836467 RepID=A0A1B7Z3F1_9FLAO|nr:diphosphomevalonate decarboxylase [Maribacter hydrothermalis]APQ16943.1 diphosphomevalonate decarboxylase [Maribacter hydrothermalis]OBR37204.1 diphosphomevalonate decarboxylase [Maribacter hydrothermalis]